MIAFVMNVPGCENLYQNSIDAGVVLFKSDSLEVYAADWRYQLVGKIVRGYQLSTMNETVQAQDRLGKDLADAVSILHLLVSERGGKPLQKTEMMTWYGDGPTLEDAEIAPHSDIIHLQEICENVPFEKRLGTIPDLFYACTEFQRLRQRSNIATPLGSLLKGRVRVFTKFSYEIRLIVRDASPQP